MNLIDSILKFLGQKSVVIVESGSDGNWDWTLWSDGTAELNLEVQNESIEYGPTTNFGGYLGLASKTLPNTGKTLSDFNVTGVLIPQNSRCVQSIARVYNGALQISAYADSAKTVYTNYNAKIKCRWK